MMSKVKAAFDEQEIELPLEHISLQREISPTLRKSQTYRQIAASLENVGLVEPVVVFPRGPNDYLLLDGHVRIDILKTRNTAKVRAIISTDDEAYTYNKRVNSLPPVAQHLMIMKVLESGVSEERIAKALNVDIATIRRKRNMLEGICSEAVDILKTKKVSVNAFSVLRKMKPYRQIEAAEHMVASNKYSVSFARALLLVTRPELLVEPACEKRKNGKSTSALLLLEREKESIVQDLRSVEESYGTDILAFTVICGYVERLLRNNRVESYLSKHQPDILVTLRSVLADAKRTKSSAASLS